MITEDGKCEADMRSRLGMARSVLSELKHIMEKQSDHVMHQATPTKILGLACWNLWSGSMVLWEVGTAKITEFETICYRRVMRMPLTATRRNEDILEEVGGRQHYGTQLSQGSSYISVIS